MPSEIFDGDTPSESTYGREVSTHGNPATGPGVEPPVCCVCVMYEMKLSVSAKDL